MNGPPIGVAPLPAGTRVGSYEVLGHLATGGMGEVYLARKTGIAGFEHLVVLKIMLAHLARDERFSQMFIDEARISSQLSHPNIVQVFDLDRANGQLYLAMEHLDGQSVASCLRHVAQAGVFMPVEVVGRIIADSASGLAHAHAAKDGRGASLGVVHRDVSPENLFVTYAGPTKVLDFGVAKVRGKLAQTQEGEFKGKVAYMAPEIIRGMAIDGRADLFGLGVVMFEMLTTRRLFHAPNPATTLHRVLGEPIPDVRALRADVDAQIAELVNAMLERDPKKRVQTADEVSERLETYLAPRSGTTKAAGHWLSSTFTDAREVSARIHEHVLRTGYVDPLDLLRAREYGNAKLDDSALRELSREERAAAKQFAIATAVDAPEENALASWEDAEDQDTTWIVRASAARWMLGLILVVAFSVAMYSLYTRGIGAERLHLPEAGEVVAERYEIVAPVHESRRSSIYRAHDRKAQNAAALLWISERVAKHEVAGLLEAHRQAAERIQHVRHPSIPDVHDVGAIGDRVYCALEGYEGRTLAEMLEREMITGKRVRKILLDLAGALAVAESRGLIHGALDPTRVLIDRDDAVTVLGFEMGFAPSVLGEDYPHRAPEVKPGAAPTSRADQYSLGSVTNEVLRVWDQEGAVKAGSVIARATLSEPLRRYESIDHFARDLEQVFAVKRSRSNRR